MAEVEFNNEDEYKVKIVNGGEYKEPGGGIRKPSQEEIDAYRIHRVVVMVVFALVVVLLLLLIVILIATTDGCVDKEETKMPWYKSGVMYHVYPRSFKDSNGDGVGDFKGVTEKLDYIKGLGVNILYLSSVFKVDKDIDYGYSVVDFNETNTDYGSLNEFQKLVDSAHDKGLKVIIEFVPCDTSIHHGWFNESKRETGKLDWYVWRDSTTNTSSLPGHWAKDRTSGKFYLHQKGYGGKKANLNWNDSEVQKELERVLGFWLDRKVDGFRIVSVQRLFGGDPTTTNDWTKIHTRVQKWHNYTREKSPNSILIGSSHPANLDLYGMSGKPELDIVLNFELVADSGGRYYTASYFKAVIDGYIEKLKKGNWPSWALTSWVHGRVGSNVNKELANSLQALLLMLPGTPIVFYGDEIGMMNVNAPNISSEDINKAPMLWDDTKNGGFTSGSTTWFGAVGDSSYSNVKEDQLGMITTFKKAIKLRMDNASGLLDGPLSNFTVMASGNVLAFTFVDQAPRFAVVLNFGGNEMRVNLSELGVMKAVLKFHTCDKTPDTSDVRVLKVPGNALLVLEVTERTKS